MVADHDSANEAQRCQVSGHGPAGTLWQRVIEVHDRALRSGHLLPIATREQLLADGAAVFRAHIVENLRRKQRVASAGPSTNPFLPYAPELYVADVGRHHVALLNRFNVVDHHLLIVTRTFEAQVDRLNWSDFQALWSCLLEYNSLGFYNSGVQAGASQPHKHLQLIPIDDATVTLEPLYDLPTASPLRVGKSTKLPFEHRLVGFVENDMHDVEQSATTALRLYDDIIGQLGWHCVGADTPYNLLITRRWMLFVPRRRECFESISLNAMAFAGSLLVKDVDQLKLLRDRGPMTALVDVSGELDV